VKVDQQKTYNEQSQPDQAHHDFLAKLTGGSEGHIKDRDFKTLSFTDAERGQ